MVAGYKVAGQKQKKKGGGGVIFNTGGSLHRNIERLMFGLKTYDSPAKNVSSSKVTANHTKRGEEGAPM